MKDTTASTQFRKPRVTTEKSDGNSSFFQFRFHHNMHCQTKTFFFGNPTWAFACISSNLPIPVETGTENIDEEWQKQELMHNSHAKAQNRDIETSSVVASDGTSYSQFSSLTAGVHHLHSHTPSIHPSITHLRTTRTICRSRTRFEFMGVSKSPAFHLFTRENELKTHRERLIDRDRWAWLITKTKLTTSQLILRPPPPRGCFRPHISSPEFNLPPLAAL